MDESKIQSKMLGADKDKDFIKNLEDIKKKIESNIEENILKDFNEKWNSLNNMEVGKFLIFLLLMKLQLLYLNFIFF